MTRRDEMVRMLQESGYVDWLASHNIQLGSMDSPQEEIERFAALVAKAERERCAKDAEAIRDDYVATGSNLQACAADYIAEKIRALKYGGE